MVRIFSFSPLKKYVEKGKTAKSITLALSISCYIELLPGETISENLFANMQHSYTILQATCRASAF